MNRATDQRCKLSSDDVIGGGQAFYYWLKRNEFPQGYETLCFNCNSSKGAYGYCPHEGEGG